MSTLNYKIVLNYKKKKYIDNKEPVQIYISCNREVKIIGTGIYVKADQFNNKEQRIEKHPDAGYLNNKIKALILNIQNIEMDALRNNRTISINDFDTKNQSNKNSLIDYILSNYKNDPALKSSDTQKHHKALTTALKNAGLIYFDDLTLANIEKLDTYLRDTGISVNTVATYHRRLKRWISHAIKHGIQIDNPYANFKVESKESRIRRYLTPEELDRLVNTQLSKTSLEKVRDIFVFVCYTGYSYSDAAKLKQSDIFVENDEYFIHNPRQKTEIGSPVMLLPQALKIIKKYKSKKTDNVLPHISLTNYNVFLKAVAVECKITAELTSHMARHTFATTVCLSNGVPIETVSKMLGHKNIKTTQIYAKVMRDKIANDMKALRIKLK